MPPRRAGIFTTWPGLVLTRSPPLYGACRPRPFGSPPSASSVLSRVLVRTSAPATIRGLPSKAVWFASERLVYSVVARPEFKSLKELRGKRIAVTGLGGTSEVVLRIGLEAAGENPKDFVIVGLGAAQL